MLISQNGFRFTFLYKVVTLDYLAVCAHQVGLPPLSLGNKVHTNLLYKVVLFANLKLRQ